ncbi:MAG: hypothetical protein ABJE66_17095 [Deltaproteobacteria bacterium]
MRGIIIAFFAAAVACGSSPGGSDAAGGSGDMTKHDASTGSGSGSGTGSGSDVFATARMKCIAKINALRATESKTAFGEWKSAETCVDGEVTSDEMTGQPHHAWQTNNDSCKGNGQNECEGQGPDGIEACLQSMWNEKDQADCSGCAACANAYNPSCANCDFFGTLHGQVCGHYVNLSANYFTMAACGFSSLGGWDAINFE